MNALLSIDGSRWSREFEQSACRRIAGELTARRRLVADLRTFRELLAPGYADAVLAESIDGTAASAILPGHVARDRMLRSDGQHSSASASRITLSCPTNVC